jgi:hypothetical protein
MDDTYESITAAAIDAIQAIIDAPKNSVIFLDDSAKVVACCIYFSWVDYAGDSVRQEDTERIMRLINAISDERAQPMSHRFH